MILYDCPNIRHLCSVFKIVWVCYSSAVQLVNTDNTEYLQRGTDLLWSWIVRPVFPALLSAQWGSACGAALYLETPPATPTGTSHSLFGTHPTWRTLMSRLAVWYLTEGERDRGGVSCRASSGWFPIQSRDGDILGGSSCSTLTPTPTIISSPHVGRRSAGGLGSTIL